MRRRIEKMEKEEEPMSLVLSISRDVVVPLPSLTVSLPLSAYHDCPVQSLEVLHERQSASLPPTWRVACQKPLALCRLRMHVGGQHPPVDVGATIVINTDIGWTLLSVDT